MNSFLGYFLVAGTIYGTISTVLFVLVTKVAKPIPRKSHFLGMLALIAFVALPIASYISPSDLTLFRSVSDTAINPLDDSGFTSEHNSSIQNSISPASENSIQPLSVSNDNALTRKGTDNYGQSSREPESSNAERQSIRQIFTTLVARSWHIVWLIGIAASVGYLVAGHISVWRIFKRSKLVGMLRSKRNNKENIGIFQSPSIRFPFAYGFFRKMIFVPESFADESIRNEKLRENPLILHEMHHIERSDSLYLLIVRLIVSIFWFVPTAWYLSNKISQLAEIDCDMRAVEITGVGVYLRKLATVLISMYPYRLVYTATQNISRSLKRRIKILEKGDYKMKPKRINGFLGVILALPLLIVALTIPVFGGGFGEGSPEADWPQWGGPNRNFTSNETGYDPQAFADGVNILWETGVGPGTSSVVISDGWLYTLGLSNYKLSAFCINTKNGKVRWTVPIQSASRGKARSTPAVDGDRLYATSPLGELHCLRTDNGEIIWSVNLIDQYEMAIGSSGYAPGDKSSPIVVGEMVIVHGMNALIAFNKMTGDEIWTYIDDDERPLYYGLGNADSTPFPTTIESETYLIRKGPGRLEAFAAMTGKQITNMEIPYMGFFSWPTTNDGVVDGSRILVNGVTSEGLVDEMISFNGSEFTVEWKSSDFAEAINHFVFVDRYLYGFTIRPGRRQSGNSPYAGLVCVDASSGREIWREPIPSTYTGILANGGITYVDDIYFLLTDDGKLITADLSPAGYNEFSIGMMPDYPSTWYVTPAVVSGGRLFIRSTRGKLFCVNVGVK